MRTSLLTHLFYLSELEMSCPTLPIIISYVSNRDIRFLLILLT